MMNKFLLFTAGTVLVCTSFTAMADQWVNGYTRSDGTHVEGHYRSDPNGTVTDNYSFKGNRNPHTGEIGTNRYSDDRSSPYYDGGSSLGSGTGYDSGIGSGSNSGFDSGFDSGYDDPY